MATLRSAHRMMLFAASTQTIDSPRVSRRGWLIGGAARSDWRELLRPRAVPGFGKLESLSLLVYTLLLAWCIPHHEGWFDEAQAWLIARDSSLVDMVVHRLHYEGSPALWHLLLWTEVRLGVSFLGMHLIAGALAAVGVYVWLRYCPLPRVVTLFAPFTFYLIYQYAVVARSYVLAPLFVYGLLALYANRRSSPMVFALVAGLFANCSLHMAAMAAGLAVLYAMDRLWGEGAKESKWRLLAPAALLTALFVVSAATAMPTADGSSTTANPLVEGIRNKVSHSVEKVVEVQTGPHELTNEGMLTEPPVQGPLATKVWLAINRKPELGHRSLLDGRVLKHLLVLMTAVTAPISTSNLLAAVFLLLLCVNLMRARLWLALLPYALVQVCNVLVSGEAHHIGLVWIAMMGAIWLLALRPPRAGWDVGLRGTLYGCLLVVMLLQIGWSAHALAGDLRLPYSSSKATAIFLATVPKENRIAAFDDDSVTVNAYLPSRPYFNQQVDYWPFSRTKDPSLLIEQTMAQRPEMVLLKMAKPVSPVMDQWVKLVPAGSVFVDQKTLNMLESQGYRETHRFCGDRFYRNTAESMDCRLVFERETPLR
ncbi:hypothetical protein [Granulicella arctica]|uniref:Glycosyltransferase RgtA/B/C/D-like domain-containing protein n=1 Tax=Granulicella arctica TaxID=940613 RepID=A0A7Y9THI2_9BACT|nr:hypothetical protein [Granulicella arctica]NYF79915.1 hypothetical protein [Granulicella arctica]